MSVAYRPHSLTPDSDLSSSSSRLSSSSLPENCDLSDRDDQSTTDLAFTHVKIEPLSPPIPPAVPPPLEQWPNRFWPYEPDLPPTSPSPRLELSDGMHLRKCECGRPAGPVVQFASSAHNSPSGYINTSPDSSPSPGPFGTSNLCHVYAHRPISGFGFDSDLSLTALSTNAGPSGSESAAPGLRPTTASTSASVSRTSHSAKTTDDQHSRKRRKTSPPATAPPLVRNNSTSKAPNHKKKTPRSSGPAAPPTRAQQALLTRDVVSSSRAGSQHVVADDTPLPPPPPRVGMGEGGYESPKESALREEASIRREAEFLRESTARKLIEDEKRRQREEMNGTTLVTGKRARRSVNYADVDDEDVDVDDYSMINGYTGPNGAGGPGPSTTNTRRRRSGVESLEDSPFASNPNQIRRTSSSIIDNFPPPVVDKSFEAQYAHLQKVQRAQVAAQRAADKDRPPALEKIRKPTVVLARSGQASYHPRDRTEQDYLDGLAGMSKEMEVDAHGFVDNVKDNLRAILKYYFPERSTRRDAFCERIGRGLAQFGWELTDNSDAALLP